MKTIKIFLVTAMLAISIWASAADISETFAPSPGVKAVVAIKGTSLIWKVYRGNQIKQGRVDLEMEKTPHIEIGSYDFSGRLGFSVSHIDDGMGTHGIHRVFTFSPSTNDFVERAPSCGDGFVNLQVDKRRRLLKSTYWDQNVQKICTTRLSIDK